MIKDYFRMPWNEIKQKGLRSWLTLLGVFIGIAAIISLITLGQGLENAINKQFNALGKDKIFISPKGGSYGGIGSSVVLTSDDLEKISKTSGVKLATGMDVSNGRYEYNDVVRYNFVSGIPLSSEERSLIGESQNWKIKEGRMLRKGDKYKIVLGHSYTEKSLFEKKVELGDKILISGFEFKVVGFLEKIGSPPDDKSGMIPLGTFEEVYNKKDELGVIIVQTQPGEEVNKVAEEIKKELRKFRDVDEGEEDFTVESSEQFAESFSTILDIVRIVLVGIAAISLLVGGIGIMNTMYTSVLERTKEIGIMKALGAKNSNILFFFLIESGFYGLGGGIIGAVIGLSLAKLTEYVFTLAVGPAFLSVEFNWELVLGTLLFSFVVGCLSGIAPARQASKLKPIDALRYE